MRIDLYELERKLNQAIEEAELINRYYKHNVLESQDLINLRTDLMNLKFFIDNSVKGDKTNEENN